MKTKINRCYIVADRGRARILVGDPRNGKLDAINALESPAVHSRSRDLGSDRPGHTQEAVGAARHAVEAPDYHAKAAQAFAESIACEITAGLDAGSYDRLILVAPTRFLAELRAALPPKVEPHIEAILAKDLTRIPTAELAPRLAEIRASA